MCGSSGTVAKKWVLIFNANVPILITQRDRIVSTKTLQNLHIAKWPFINTVFPQNMFATTRCSFLRAKIIADA